MAKFFAGEVVRLNSGGPEMTVIEYVKIPVNSGKIKIDQFARTSYKPATLMDTTKVKCSWFDGTKLMKDQFEEATLEKSL